MPQLRTERLSMVSWTQELVDAALDNPSRLEALLGATIAKGFPNDPVRRFVLPTTRVRLQHNPADGEWSGMIIHVEDNVVIGSMGFKSPPNENGLVEMGYDIVPSYRGQGYATEMARALVNWAQQQSSVHHLTAECLSDNWASIRVLEKLGMQRIEEHGTIIYWEFPIPEQD
ncbi:GNAT family N-acetyltransferase [Sulfobacillus harzensis]|uniref:GNAT family N-acetyltransferase n=1 Tax=Sulfobacillus harzensis TaxID=2729629 RepID=A0A7Y0L1N4_9FIRM|nr:GNAT family N-acetyltransferase [Sulfobacillus harzensis]NMP21651.1 GNAT family N-acetyltransferase [Sulfobacillus harzensis]